MSAYLVRICADAEHGVPLEIVGIFACPLSELPYYVDMATDTWLCEYTKIGGGGILWADRAATVPILFDEDAGETAAELFTGATVTEGGWWESIYTNEPRKWTPVEGI